MDAVRYKLTLAYEGTDFHGWQKQEPPLGSPAARGTRLEAEGGDRAILRTVQEVVERAVREVVREPVTLVGASRTDAGVHAEGQVAAFSSSPDAERGVGWPEGRGCDRLVRAVNGRLPADVLVRSAEVVPLGFDPIADASSKAYRYTIATSQTRPLWDRRTVYWTYHELDVGAMDAAAKLVEGEHDFAAFAQADHGRKTTVRTVFSCGVSRGEDGRVRIEVAGSGFLYNMVRIIAGTLVEVGRGRLEPGSIAGIIGSADRANAGPTLPPEGLCLLWIRHGA